MTGFLWAMLWFAIGVVVTAVAEFSRRLIMRYLGAPVMAKIDATLQRRREIRARQQLLETVIYPLKDEFLKILKKLKPLFSQAIDHSLYKVTHAGVPDEMRYLSKITLLNDEFSFLCDSAPYIDDLNLLVTGLATCILRPSDKIYRQLCREEQNYDTKEKRKFVKTFNDSIGRLEDWLIDASQKLSDVNAISLPHLS